MRMETDQLIRTLAADNAHRARPVAFMLALALLSAAPVSIAIFFAGLGVRPDVMTAMHNPFFDLKFAVTLALAISAIAVSLHLSRPEVSLRAWGWLLLIPAGILLAGIGCEMMMPQRLPMMTRLVGSNSRICLTAIPLMSLPLLAAALIGLRHGALGQQSEFALPEILGDGDHGLNQACVVPAKAGTHKPRPLYLTLGQTAF